jgi:hypothetical protein
MYNRTWLCIKAPLVSMAKAYGTVVHTSSRLYKHGAPNFEGLPNRSQYRLSGRPCLFVLLLEGLSVETAHLTCLEHCSSNGTSPGYKIVFSSSRRATRLSASSPGSRRQHGSNGSSRVAALNWLRYGRRNEIACFFETQCKPPSGFVRKASDEIILSVFFFKYTKALIR